jgi:hypothetical protein
MRGRHIEEAAKRGMMTRRGAVAVLAVSCAALLVLSGCNRRLSEGPHRYKMTIEIDTPQGVKSGYAVREVTPIATFQGGGSASVKGEAVAVDLPGGQVLFALLTGDGGPDYGPRIAYWMLDRELRPGGANPNYQAGKFAELYPTRPNVNLNMADALPLFVRFRDLNDPKSVERVLPDDLESKFGAGVKLKRVTIEIVREDVTVGIGKRFAWWEKYRAERRTLDGSNSVAISSNQLSAYVGTGEFSAGFEQ